MSRARRLVLIVSAGLIVVIGAYALVRWSSIDPIIFGPESSAAEITVSGNIEAHESVLSFAQVAAPITYLPFDEGTRVAAGTILARVDDRLYKRQTEIDQTNLEVATTQITAAKSNFLAAQNTVVSDKFDSTEKQREYSREEALFKTHVASQELRDQALTAAQQSAAILARDQALVQVANNNVALAEANLDAVEAKLKLDQVTLSYTVLRAPFSGVIAERDAELGQLAGPGVAIFTLDDLDHVWLRGYVNEPDIGKIRLGEAVDVTTDTYPNKVYHGTIGFISSEAEFTPKTVETHAERVSLVYRIRIDIDNPTHELLPGMPADGMIAVLGPGK